MNRKVSSFSLVFILFFSFLFLSPIALMGQATGFFRLFFDDMITHDFANWSYDLDDPGYIHGDANPFTWNDGIASYYHTYAYYRFGWYEGSEYSCIMEDLPFAADPGDVHISDYTDFYLVGFSKINTVDPAGAWGEFGESGEARTYMASFYKITCGSEWMNLSNIKLDAVIPYATHETMRTNLLALGLGPDGAGNWQSDMGTGHPVTGHGRANITGASAGFRAAMDNGSGQIEFDLVTFDYLIQGSVGYYDMIIDVYPATQQNFFANPEVDLGGIFPQQFNLADVDLDIEVATAIGGGPLHTMNTIWIDKIPGLPAKALPAGITHLAPVYWDISTTLDSYEMDITFDISDYLPFGDPENWRLCRRNNESASWVIYPNTSVTVSTITALDVNDLSQWAVGYYDESTLPVELSAFTAFVTSDNLVNLAWTTQSETGLSGYSVYRNTADDLATAIDLRQFIEATNSSNSHSYSFVEENTLEPGTYYYWLQAMELNGESSFHGPAVITLSSEGENPPSVPIPTARLKAFPNPFNPLTQIGIYVPEAQSGQCTIYNARGERVCQYSPQSFLEGWNYLSWDGRDAHGNACGSGIYLIRVDGRELSLQTKVVLMK